MSAFFGQLLATSGRIAATTDPVGPTDDEVFRLWGWILIWFFVILGLTIAGILLYRKLRDDRRNREYYARMAAQGGERPADPVAALAGDGRKYVRDGDTDREFSDTFHEQPETHLKLGPTV